MPDRRAVISGGLLLLGAALAPAIEPRRFLARELPALDLARDVPERFGDWRLDRSIPIVQPSPDVEAELARLYTQQLSRTYANDRGERVMLVIAYGEDQASRSTIAHLPEHCYPAQGFAVSAQPARPVDLGPGTLPVSRYLARRPGRVEPITYWTVVGARTFASESDRRWERVFSSLGGVVPDGMLVRVSSIGGDVDGAYRLHDGFVRDLRAGLGEAVRPRLFGSSRAAAAPPRTEFDPPKGATAK